MGAHGDRGLGFSSETTSAEKGNPAHGEAPIDDGLGQPFTGTIYELMEEYGFKNTSKFSVGINDLILICLQVRKCPSGETTHVVRRTLGQIS